MTTTATRPVSLQRPPDRRRRRPRRVTGFGIALAVGVLCIASGVALVLPRDANRSHYIAATGWPAEGQASYQLGAQHAHASPGQHPVPIASVAKVMTAYLTLASSPLADAPFLRVTAADVADTSQRAARNESIVAVSQGEVLTERQALEALLLPSANNVAVMIARRVDGSVAAFVAHMNRAARRLGMTSTTYTDPSGYDPATVSTAADQLVLAQAAMRDDGFAELVGMSTAALPVAGTVRNTDTLLGTAGFVGIKTGSDDAAGGCFMFRTWRSVNGELLPLTGVVLGQHDHRLIDAALTAARQLADRVAPHVGTV